MGAERTGWDEIRQGYDMYKSCPYWALFETRASNSSQTGRLLFSYTGEDMEDDGWRLLEENLKVVEQSAPTIRYILQFYNNLDKQGSINDKQPYQGSFIFRMKAQALQPAGGGIGAIQAQPAEASLFLQYLQHEIAVKDERIRELEGDIEDLEDQIEEYKDAEKTPKIGGAMGAIGEVVTQYPPMGDLFKEVLSWFKPMVTRSAPAPGIAGVPEDAATEQAHTENADKVIGKCIRKLANYYVKKEGYFKPGISDEEKEAANTRGWVNLANDLSILANKTDDEKNFEMLIMMLRLQQ